MRLRARTLLPLAAPLLISACATTGPPLPPSLDVPKPPTDLRAVRKGDRVILTWTIPSSTTDRQTIRTLGRTEICRAAATDMQQCGTPVAKVVSNPTASLGKAPLGTYTDTLPGILESDDSSAFAMYAVQVLNTDGRGAGLSNRVRIPLIRTLPPPQGFEAQVTDQGVALSWTSEVPAPHPDVHYAYRIYRHRTDEPPQSLIAEVPATNQRAYSFTDSQIEWQKTYEYHAEAVTVVSQPNKPEIQVEGEDTPTIQVFANDVFPPAAPSGLQAVFSGPGQQLFIDLVWAPVSDVDLAGYNVYRHIEGAAPVKINAELVKTPACRDASVESGQRYFYSVTSVDLRGNESGRSDEASETVPR